MLRRFSTNFAIICMLMDALLTALALYLAFELRPAIGESILFIRDMKYIAAIPSYLYLVFPVIWVLVFMLLSVYDSNKNLKVADELNSVIWGSLLASIIIAGLLFLSYREISRVLFITFVLMAMIFQILYRFIFRLAFRFQIFKNVEEKRILIIGAGIVGRRLEVKMRDYNQIGYKIIGFVDDKRELVENKKEVLGVLSDTFKIVKKEKITDIVFALPQRAHDKVHHLVGELHTLPVKIWIIPDYFAIALNQAVMLDFAGLPMIDLRAPAFTNYQRMIKRLFDLFIAIPTTILASPFLLLIGLLIRLDSPGPAIYASERAGENGKLFHMLKFRTMVVGADKHLAAILKPDSNGRLVHKIPNDPRVTRIGKFLRRTSLDELPQLINVIKGEMSLVGPRPELPLLVDKYEPWQRKRFSVPQGITGWWQVNGRSDNPMHMHTNEDIYYIQNYSIWLDMQILLKTIWVVFTRRGAF